MAVNDIYMGVIEQLLHSQTILNVLFFRVNDATATGVTELNNDIRTEIVPLMKAVQSNELTHVAVHTQKIFPLPPEISYRNTGASGAGSVAQNSLPTSMAVVITKKTVYAGRKYRGRMFVAGVPTTHEDNSALADANVATWQSLADVIGGGGGWLFKKYSPILWHRSTKTADAVVSGVVRTILRNQRRRQLQRGV